ncbi:MAG: hypothetical protein QNJ55_01405 [Xenococcus sp. MO_188.B8]|nr:hypothetical protein [Xenococcus sp. MO_188.B8]
MQIIVSAQVILFFLQALVDERDEYELLKRLLSEIITNRDIKCYIIALSWQIIRYKLDEYENPDIIIEKLKQVLHYLPSEELTVAEFENPHDEYLEAVEGSFMVAYATRQRIDSIVTVSPIYSFSTVVKIYSPEEFLQCLAGDLVDSSVINSEITEINLHELLTNYNVYPTGWSDPSNLIRELPPSPHRGYREIAKRIPSTSNTPIALIIGILRVEEKTYEITLGIRCIDSSALSAETNLIVKNLDNDETAIIQPQTTRDLGLRTFLHGQINDRFRVDIVHGEEPIYRQLCRI